MWSDCCSCSSWSPISSSAGEIHYARSIMPPSGAARKLLLLTFKFDFFWFEKQTFLLVLRRSFRSRMSVWHEPILEYMFTSCYRHSHTWDQLQSQLCFHDEKHGQKSLGVTALYWFVRRQSLNQWPKCLCLCPQKAGANYVLSLHLQNIHNALFTQLYKSSLCNVRCNGSHLRPLLKSDMSYSPWRQRWIRILKREDFLKVNSTNTKMCSQVFGGTEANVKKIV